MAENRIDVCAVSLRASLIEKGLVADEADMLSAEITREAKKIAKDTGMDIIEAYKEAGAKVSIRKRADDMRAQMGKTKNLRKGFKLASYAKEQFPDQLHLGVKAILVGINSDKKGSRASVANKQQSVMNGYFGSLIADLEKTDTLKILKDTTNDGEVLRAMELLSRNGDTSSIGKPILDAANIINSHQKLAMLDLADEGLKIDFKNPFWLLRTAHKSDLLIRGGRSGSKVFRIKDEKAARDKWATFIGDLIDWDKTELPLKMSKEEWLNQRFSKYANGTHLKHDGIESGYVGSGDLSKRLEDGGDIIWKDGASFLKYNAEYGAGSLREAAYHGLEMTAKNVGIIRVLGTNPEEQFNMLRKRLQVSAEDRGYSVKQTEKLSSKGLDNAFDEITGASNLPGNKTAARIGSVARALQTMSKLGSAVLSSFSDLPLYAAEARYQGRGMLSAYAEAVGGLVKGKRNSERRQLGSLLGSVSDSMRGHLGFRFSTGDSQPGSVTKLLQGFFKLNGLEWWTDSLRHSAIIGMSHHLGLNKGLKFDALDDDLRRILSLFNIDEGKWGMLGKVAQTEADGRMHIIPENTSKISDQDVKDYAGKNMSEDAIRKFKRSLEEDLRGYYVDRADYMVLNPQADTQAVMKQGLRPGTVMGEIARFFWQFKAFPLQIMRGPLSRELSGGKVSGGGTLMGLTHIGVMATALGYLSLSAKDLVQGKEPRDPLAGETVKAAFVQGGASSFFGDYLIGGTARYGDGAVGASLGPTLGTIEDATKIFYRARDGEDWGPSAVRLASQNTPGANLFYLKWAYNHFFMYNIQESMSPGYLKRMEKRIKEETGQEFYKSPYDFVKGR